MPLVLEQPDYAWFLRGASATEVRVNDRVLTRSCLLAPDQLVEDWPARDPGALTEADLQAMLALRPDVLLLGTGARQVFPPAAWRAACLARGIGLEVMDNAAAARTYTVLAAEGRRVVAGFLLPG